jgi:hypothetical protein
VAKLSLIDTSYSGPRRCWKCHEYFAITIENNRVTSCESLSREEYEKKYPAKTAPEKVQLGFDFAPKREDNGSPPVTPQRQRDHTKPFIPEEPAGRSATGKPATDFPPDRPRTFVPLEDTDENLEKPKKPKNPPEKQRDSAEPGKPGIFPRDRFRTFVPLEDIDEKPRKP